MSYTSYIVKMDGVTNPKLTGTETTYTYASLVDIDGTALPATFGTVPEVNPASPKQDRGAYIPSVGVSSFNALMSAVDGGSNTTGEFTLEIKETS